MASTADLIRTAIERFQAEVPALAKLKLVFGLELRAKHDIQLYRVELPGPVIKKDLAQDERVLVEIDRPQFNQLAEKGTLASYRRAAELADGGERHPLPDHGHVPEAVEGRGCGLEPPQVRRDAGGVSVGARAVWAGDEDEH